MCVCVPTLSVACMRALVGGRGAGLAQLQQAYPHLLRQLLCCCVFTLATPPRPPAAAAALPRHAHALEGLVWWPAATCRAAEAAATAAAAASPGEDGGDAGAMSPQLAARCLELLLPAAATATRSGAPGRPGATPAGKKRARQQQQQQQVVSEAGSVLPLRLSEAETVELLGAALQGELGASGMGTLRVPLPPSCSPQACGARACRG